MTRTMTETDRNVITIAERYVRLQLIDDRDHKEAVSWREFHELEKLQFMSYPRRVN